MNVQWGSVPDQGDGEVEAAANGGTAAEQRPGVGSAFRNGASEPSLAELLDPIAWENRLREARARREAALARRACQRAEAAEERSSTPDPSTTDASSADEPWPDQLDATPAEGASRAPAFAAPAARPAVAALGAPGPSVRDVVRAGRFQGQDAPAPFPGPVAEGRGDAFVRLAEHGGRLQSRGDPRSLVRTGHGSLPRARTTPPRQTAAWQPAEEDEGHVSPGATAGWMLPHLLILFVLGLLIGLGGAYFFSDRVLGRVMTMQPAPGEAPPAAAHGPSALTELPQLSSAVADADAWQLAPEPSRTPRAQPPIAPTASDELGSIPRTSIELGAVQQQEPPRPLAEPPAGAPPDLAAPVEARPQVPPELAVPGPDPIDTAALLPPPETAPPPTPPPSADDAAAQAAYPAAGTPPPTGTARANAPRVVVHVPTGVAASLADRAVASAAAGGFQTSDRIAVQLAIGRTNVRYYHRQDAEAANRLAAALARSDDPATARDFTSFRPLPPQGTIEVWLKGEPSAAATARQRVEPRRQQAAPAARQSSAPPRTQPAPPPSPRLTASQLRELEALADEIARAIARRTRN